MIDATQLRPEGCRVIAAVTAEAATVPSPCTGVCRIDPRTGWCEGCQRTLDEIAAWSTLANDDRRAMWDALAQRRGEPTGG